MGASPEQCAAALLETIPLVMRNIRSHVRGLHQAELSVPAFRSLLFLQEHREASLSALAEFIGLSLPSISKLIESLVTRGLVTRQADSEDRRRVTLDLTPAGVALMERTRQSARAYLAEILARRSDPERAAIAQALEILKPAFTPLPKPGNGRTDKKVVR